MKTNDITEKILKELKEKHELYGATFDSFKPYIIQALQQQKEAIYNHLMEKQEFVTYKKDGGHGVAVPLSEIMDPNL